MTQTPTIADYPAFAHLIEVNASVSGRPTLQAVYEPLIAEFTALLETNRRYREALEQTEVDLIFFLHGSGNPLQQQEYDELLTISHKIKQALKTDQQWRMRCPSMDT